MQRLIYTNAGRGLKARMDAGETTATFTKMKTSAHDYSGANIEELTSLKDIKQDVLISDVSVVDEVMVKIFARIDNMLVEDGYFIRAIGIYAEDAEGNELLYGVSLADEVADWMPAFNGTTPTGYSYTFNAKVSNSDAVTIVIDPAAVPSQEQFNAKIQKLQAAIDNLDQAIAEAKDLRASLSQHGMVKLTESSAVTDSTGLALAATEKNAMIPGTLANQLSQLNTDFAKLSRGIRFYMDSKNMPNGFTIRDDGLVVVNDVEIYQGDIVYLAGTNNGTPYGSFSGLFYQGNYGAVRTDYFSSNSINTSDVYIGANGAWGGQLCFRITPSGTLPTNGFCDFKIVVISCKRFYL